MKAKVDATLFPVRAAQPGFPAEFYVGLGEREKQLSGCSRRTGHSDLGPDPCVEKSLWEAESETQVIPEN